MSSSRGRFILCASRSPDLTRTLAHWGEWYLTDVRGFRVLSLSRERARLWSSRRAPQIIPNFETVVQPSIVDQRNATQVVFRDLYRSLASLFVSPSSFLFFPLFFSLKKKEIDHRFAARADIRFLMRTLRPRTRLSRLRRLQHCGLRIVPAIVISFVRFLETRESNIIDPCIVLIGEFATIKREKEKKLEQHTLYHRR